MTRTDIIIIGSGPGGYPAACRAAAHGRSVTIIEDAEVGGTCLNCGCIPTKTLCRNAEIVDTLRDAESYGLGQMSYNLDFAQVMRRKADVVGQLRRGVETLLGAPGITLVRGHGSLLDNRTVAVGDDVYSADNIIIATGSRPSMPPIEGIGLQGVVTSTGLLEVTEIPRRLCIVGAGVIGMEFASIFSSLGSEVTVIEFLKEALPSLDSDIAKRLRQTMARRGVAFSMQSAVKSVRESTTQNGSRQLTVTYEKKGKPAQADADVVLIATGRTPCVDGIGLENAGVEYTRKGIAVDGNYMTSVPGIYAIGDVNGQCMLAHAATFQGTRAINHILGIGDKIRPQIMPAAVFTNPEAASVGYSEDECRASGIEYTCRKTFYRANGKALAMNETEGMLKLLAAPDSGLLLGCHAFGAHAADMVQEVAALMNAQATLATLADTVHIHPTLAEILHSAAL